ncbi:YcaO-like family protein [Halomicrococcus gelatinilyticus]|uniref:YcaO-like family protein n=1 Tax=Halomicrococcus gelatinilyticus TaxID=1702103 RepID=UPI002E10A1BF
MSERQFGVVGDGPAAAAVRAGLSDVDGAVEQCSATELDATAFGVVVGHVGDDAFARANRSVDGTPWLAVELGGVGGHALPEVDAAVSGFGPGTACYDCLAVRVASTLDDGNANGDGGSEAVDDATARFAGALAGREAATLLSGGESPVLGGVVEVPHAERTLLPVPACDACGGQRDRTLSVEHASATLDESVARAERALDDRVGVVRNLGEVASFPVPYYLAENADTTGFSDARAAGKAAGVAADWNRAMMKALGEALERYCAGVYDAAEFGRAPADALDDAVDPRAFVRPDDWGDADGADVPWVSGRDLATGALVNLPAEFVHFPPPESRFKPPITTGLGLGNSTVEALLSGLYEVVERDATMLSWYSTFDPLGLAVDDDGFRTLEKRARAEDLSVTPLLVTQDVDVPVVAVAVHREGDWPRFAVGSGADLAPDAAARSALAEALQNWLELEMMGREEAADAEGAIARYADFPAAAREFVSPATTVPSDSVGPDVVPDGEAELDAVVARASDAFDVYAARLTTRDVAQLGFEAVRVLAPAAQPLFTGDPFFGDRARSVPAELGFEPRPDRELHPYP